MPYLSVKAVPANARLHIPAGVDRSLGPWIAFPVRGSDELTLVSPEDAPVVRELTLWRLNACRTRKDGSIARLFYVGVYNPKGVRTTTLGRVLLGAMGRTVVDYINRNTFDHRRGNLRLVTPTQSVVYTPLRWDNATGLRGVALNRYGRYEVRVAGQYLGSFSDVREAAECYNTAARAKWGSFAMLNDLSLL